MAKQQRKAGMIVRIPITSELDGFGQVLEAPEVAVLQLIKKRGEFPTADEVQAAAPLFRIWVMNNAITSGQWLCVGLAPVRNEFKQAVSRFKQDPISGQFSIYRNGADYPASASDCTGLEPASVWSAEHVEARLRDHVQGRAHKPLDNLLGSIPKPRISGH